MTEPRRFPAPWEASAIPGGYRVDDLNGKQLAYVYARDDLAGKTGGHAHLTTDEARRIAVNIARIPDLLSPAVKSVLMQRLDELAGATEGSAEMADLEAIAAALGTDK